MVRRKCGKQEEQSQQNDQNDQNRGDVRCRYPLLYAWRIEKRNERQRDQRQKIKVRGLAEAGDGRAQLPEHNERENADRKRHRTQHDAERRDLVTELEGVVQEVDDDIGDAEAEEVLESLVQQRRIGQLAQGNDRQRGRGSGGTLCGAGMAAGETSGTGTGLGVWLFSIMAGLLSFFWALRYKVSCVSLFLPKRCGRLRLDFLAGYIVH